MTATLPVRAEPVLAVSGLEVALRVASGWLPVIGGVSFELWPGETLGLVGESGCGKTVTSLAVMGLLAPSAKVKGEIVLNGRPINGSRSSLRAARGKEIAMIFQEPRRSLDPSFTVGEHVAETVRRHLGLSRTKAWKHAIELLELVEIPNAAARAKDYPHQFSGGMCQRVMLAVAIAARPNVLIADEPTTALDVTVQRQVLELIFSLQAEFGLAVLMITHDLGVVAETCDRAAVMYGGLIVEEATTEELFGAPRHPYTIGLLGSMAPLDPATGRLARIPGAVPQVSDYGDFCRFSSRCPAAAPVCVARMPDLAVASHDHLVRCARLDDFDPRELYI
jgi:peptide/nickel transport system ATP-binding protein